jgi:hypothetical protein
MKTFYFNSGVKPFNTNFEMQISRGNKFINGELHHPFYVPDNVPDGSVLYCLTDNAVELYGNYDGFIVAEVLGGNMSSKYAVFYK